MENSVFLSGGGISRKSVQGEINRSFPSPLMAAIETGQDCAVQIIGDSTCTSSIMWPQKLCSLLAAQYPQYSVYYHEWQDADGVLNDADVYSTTTVSMGTAGLRGMHFSGVNYASLRTSDIPAITGDFDLRVKASPTPGWVPGTDMALFFYNRSAGSGQWSVSYFSITAAGYLRLCIYPNDTTNVTKDSTAKVPNVGTGTPQWLRATVDKDNGASGYTITFYTSPNGSTWTQLGASIVTSTTGAITGSWQFTSDWKIGIRGTVLIPFNGEIYEVEVRDGINSPTVINPCNISAWVPYSATEYLTGAPRIDVLTGSRAGAALEYFTEERIARLCKPYGQTMAVIALGHNMANKIGVTDWLTPYMTLVQNIRTALPMAAVYTVTQNQKYSPALYISEHGIRRVQLLGAASHQGIKVIDTFGQMLSYGNITDQNGVHPTEAFNEIIAEKIWEGLRF